jgi:hypothetical protein
MGIWLDDSIPDRERRELEGLCRLLSTCVTDAVVSLHLFEEARALDHARQQPGRDGAEWKRDRAREQAHRERLETEEGLTWGSAYFERFHAIAEQARREALRQKWVEEGGPQAYTDRLVFIHAHSFVSYLATLQRALIAVVSYPLDASALTAVRAACADFAAALPGLKGVRDSTAHAEDRVRAKARDRKIEPAPVSNPLIHAPSGGAMVHDSLYNDTYCCTIADGSFAEVEVTDATTEVARVAVQAIYDALPWRPGHRHFEPSR